MSGSPRDGRTWICSGGDRDLADPATGVQDRCLRANAYSSKLDGVWRQQHPQRVRRYVGKLQHECPVTEMFDGELEGPGREAHEGEPSERIGESTEGGFAQGDQDVGKNLVGEGVHHGPRQVGTLATYGKGRKKNKGESQSRQKAATQAAPGLSSPHGAPLVAFTSESRMALSSSSHSVVRVHLP